MRCDIERACEGEPVTPIRRVELGGTFGHVRVCEECEEMIEEERLLDWE